MASNRTKFPHLTGCIENLAPTSEGKGLCFHRSAALVLDMRGAEVVMGTIRAATPEELEWMPNGSTEPFIHCWVEREGSVYAPTLIERMNYTLAPVSRDEYYRVNGVTDTYRLTRQQLLLAAHGTGLSAYFKHGKPLNSDKTVADILLEAAGVPYELTEHRTVIPRKAKCGVCGKVLGDPADPKSLNCGGDCLGCVEAFEKP